MVDRTSKVKIIFGLALIITAVITRLLALGTLPPGGPGAFLLRLPTAIAGLVTILLLVAIVYKISVNWSLAWLSGMTLTLMPWHIEQSRLYSPPLLGLTALLGGIVGLYYLRKPLVRLVCLVISLAVFYLVYPDFWVFSQSFQFPEISHYLHNLFKLISVEFLFYKNDSFWWGGLRNWGTMSPAFIPLFIIGLLEIGKKIKLTHFPLTIPFIIIWFIAAGNPTFPEGREFFLTVPYMTLVLASGILKAIRFYHVSKTSVRLLLVGYLIIISYEYVLFTHFYITHYSQRVTNEVPYDKRTF